jgi:CheY-like chemotaxis protein
MRAFESVWLVDDDELSNYVNERIIKTQQFACTVEIFTDASEALGALDLASRQPELVLPDVIFLDMEMPGLDGWDFMEAFKQLPDIVKEKCRLYMLSSSIHEADAQRAKQYKYLRDFISKPLTPEGLRVISNNILRGPA